MYFSFGITGYSQIVYFLNHSSRWSDQQNWVDVNKKQLHRLPLPHETVVFDEKYLTLPASYLSCEVDVPVHVKGIVSHLNVLQLNGSSSLSVSEIRCLPKGSVSFEKFPEIHLYLKDPSVLTHFFSYQGKLFLHAKRPVEIPFHLNMPDVQLVLAEGVFSIKERDIITRDITILKEAILKISHATVLAEDIHAGRNNIQSKYSKIFLTHPTDAQQISGLEGLFFPKSKGPVNKTSVTVNNDTVSCGNNCDGTLTATINCTCINGCSIDWLPGSPAGDGTPTIYNLCPGTYQAVVFDPCLGQFFVGQGVVSGHPQIVLINQTITQPTCKDSCDGAISIFVTAATFNISFLWSTGFSQVTTGNSGINNLCAGNYWVEISDGIGCDTTLYFTVNEPAYVDPNATATAVSCSGSCDGTATANPTGGTPPYVSYQWNDPMNQTTSTATGLCAGTYMVVVTDNNGCTGIDIATVTSPQPFNVDTTHVNVSCGGACDATIGVTVLGGGTPPYTHSWSNGATTPFLSNLCPGVYSDTLRDANNCDTVITFTVTEPLPLSIMVNSYDVKCKGVCDGAAAAYVTGGTPPYTYLWTPGNITTDSISNLCAGQYTVMVNDANNCTIQYSIIINEPDSINPNATYTDPTCPGFCNGTATANPTGGTPPYSYSWSPGGQTTQTINSLCQGIYIVTVTDANGCTGKDTVVLSVPPPLSFQLSTTNVTCFNACNGNATVSNISGGTPGYTITWSPGGYNGNPFTGLCAGNYAVTITDALGCQISQNFQITQPQDINFSIVKNDVNCNGACNGSASVVNITGGMPPYVIQWSNGQIGASAFGLCAGSYTVTVTDANGCQKTANVLINEPPVIDISLTATQVSCYGQCTGTITSSVTGGVPPYSYSWSPGGQTTPNLNNLCAGWYVLTLTDAVGCIVKDSVEITEPMQLDANVVYTDISCNGNCDGTATSLPIGGVPPYTFSWSPGGQTTQSISNLCAGQYIVTVIDANGCQDKDTIYIINPQPLSLSTSQTAASCGSICNGTATANVSGGTPPYSYTWSDGQTMQTATGLCAGNYTVTVIDANGCSVTGNVTINNLITIQITADTITQSCNGNCNGSATALATGGVAPYSYYWLPPVNQFGAVATGLCPGTYIVQATDVNGCTATGQITIPVAPSVLVNNPVLTEPLCNGDCNGSINANTSGGTPPYSWLWSPGGQTTQIITNLCAGTYVVTTTDANGCQQKDTIALTQPDTLKINAQVVQDVLCNGNCNGWIAIDVTGGTSPYVISWNNGSNNDTITGLCPGLYTVTVTDANGCQAIASYTITQPSVLQANIIPVNPSCSGMCDGQLSAMVGGGTPPYSFFWSPGGQTTQTITNQCAGNYAVFIQDQNGCNITLNATLSNPAALSVILSGGDASCNGVCDGIASAAVSGGTPPYSYLWNTGATTSSISNLCPGTYTVNVTDANGCTGTANITIAEPSTLAVTLSSTNQTCSGTCDGTATATPVGGTPPYSYSWNTGATTQSITNLCPGNYTVTVTDQNGCYFQGSVTILPATSISPNALITPANCGVCDGTISLNPSGGNPPYTYLWSPGGQTNPSLSNLCAGIYTVIITDFTNCGQTFNFAVNNNNGPVGATITANDVTCNGTCDGSANAIAIGGTPPYTYQWNDPGNQVGQTATALCAGSYFVTITDANGCIFNAPVTINEPDPLQAVFTNTNETCNGACDGTASVSVSGGVAPYTYLWQNGNTGSSSSGLCAGNTSVTVTDANGCSQTFQTTINAGAILFANINKTDVSCYGLCNGTATVIPSGGASPYTYLWSNGVTTPTVTNLCAGNYSVVVTDAQGCQYTAMVTINEPTQIQLSISATNATCGICDGSASVVPSGGAGPYSYLWNFGATTATVNALCAGTYTITVTDASGCSVTQNVGISNSNGPDISLSTSNVSCNGLCNGTASVSIVNGNGPFSFLWMPGGQTTSSVAGLCAGNYSIEVTDGNGCKTIQTFTIGEPTPLNISLSVNQVSCNGACDGSIIASVSGGTPSYSYLWNNGSITSAITGLCAGNYTLTVTDQNGCVNQASVSLTQPQNIAIQFITTNVTCFGGCDGSATAIVSGGTPPYNYLWSDGSATQTAVNLCAGIYNVTVTDASGCSASANINIGDGNPITITSNIVDASCGQCNGSASVNASGGNGPSYTYAWTPIGTSGASQNGLCPGSYTLTVSDNIGCSQNFVILVNQTGGPDISAYADSVTCYGSCDGMAWVVVNSGNPPYNYVWDDPGLSTNDTIANQCAGLYSVVVQDVNGCISVDTVSIASPQPLQANLTTTDPSCNGMCDGSIVANPSGGSGGYTYLWLPGNQTTSSLINLCSGNYSLTLTDSKGCSDVFNVVLNNPLPINISVNTTSTSCNGSCDGVASAVVNGGVGPYTYLWTPGGQTTNPAVGLCQGNYLLTVTDNNGCVQNIGFSIASPSPLSISLNASDPLCNGSCDGSITAVVNGGTPPYSYLWSNGQSSATITGLCAGTYSVIVTDAQGCVIMDAVTLVNPLSLVPNASLSQPQCGQCDGMITLNPSGGSGSYSYAWNTGQTTATISNLCAGIYTVAVTDNVSGCTDNFTFLLGNQNGPQVTLTKTDETCFNNCDGTITATVTGNGPFSYYWMPGGQTTSSITGLCAGNYIVQVTDVNGCITFDTATINSNVLLVTISALTPPSCFGDCNASATANATGGTPSYNYVWIPGGQTTQTATGLCAGNYVVQVTDQSGCSGSASATIVNPSPLMVSITVNNQPLCYGDCNGSVTAIVSGGTLPYSYQWSNGQNAQTISGLCAGTYSVVVTDGGGCSVTASIVMNSASPILDNATLTLPLCGNCDGAITTSPSGGTGPYSFLWMPGGMTSQSISNLCAGIYTLTITDNNGCSQTFTYPLGNADGPVIDVEKNNPLCYGECNGELIVSVVSGNGPFSYQWNPGAINNDTINGLCEGIYTVTVTDANGCMTIQNDTLTAPSPLDITITATQVSCGGNCDGTATVVVSGGVPGYSYQWNDPANQTTSTATGLCAGNYMVTVADQNGCTATGAISITSPGNLLIDSIVVIPTSCSAACDGNATVYISGGTVPYQINWSNGSIGSTATNLCMGNYIVSITDASGCTITSQVTITTTLYVEAMAGNDTAYCEGNGPAMLVATTVNATQWEWYSLPGFQLLSQNDTVVVNPPAGTTCYALVAFNGSCSDTDTVCVTVYPLPWVDAGPDKGVVYGQSYTITAVGAGNGLTYSWWPSQWLNTTTGPTVVTTPEQQIVYYVTVTDINGCSNTDSIIISIIPKIVFPDGISPNGDGKNDYWIIDNIDQYPNNVVEIYNRWGELLFRAQPYQNNWDGTYKGKPLPVGTYYYIINLNEPGTEVYTGPITIVR